jgi:hypothetical protein
MQDLTPGQHRDNTGTPPRVAAYTRGVALAERADEILRGLPRGWERARLDVTVEDPGAADRAAVILAPATPGRSGSTFLLHVAGAKERGLARPELVRRVLRRLDEEGIRGRIRLAAQVEGGETAAAAPAAEPQGLAAAWDELLSRLPPDWSDLYAEVGLDSTDFVERGALLLAPVNPARFGGSTTFSFRCARRRGYGVSAGMARRSLARLDEEGITGSVRVLRVLSDTHHVSTQGPVWVEGGRSI